ncbi:PIG-L family deacetylase [Candidatus Woesearchaeota archaeon]|nr:PIG-L family deacetylase [Candidatus Woesearchaeota archaeon]
MNVLVIAAHPDDEILGVGGTLLKHRKNGDNIFICIVTKGYEPEWSREYIENKLSEAKEVDNLIGTKKRFYCNFPAARLNTIPQIEFNKKIKEVIEEVNPSVIYTHFEHDIHKDHNIIFNSVMVATRPIYEKKIRLICFETMSSSEWNNKRFNPNFYVDITEFVDKKIDAFCKYISEVKEYPHPRSKKGIKIWDNKRGIEICKEYAEAFIIVRDFW